MDSGRKRKKKPVEKVEEVVVPPGSYEYKGVEKITVSPKTQKLLEIECGKHVTIEKVWKLVDKQTLQDYAEANLETSEFSSIIQKIQEYPGDTILFVYIARDGVECEEYYVCTTPESRASVEIAIEYNKQIMEEQLKNMVFRTPAKWKNLGSDREVEELLEEAQSRPLFQIEVDAKFPPCEQQLKFHNRNVDDISDGYVELTHCGRVEYDLVHKTRVDAAVQAAPQCILREGQTEPRYPTNIWTQYEFEAKLPQQIVRKEDIPKVPKINEFLNESRVNNICGKLVYSGDVELYSNDFRKLCLENSIQAPQHIDFKEVRSFSNTINEQKLVSCAAWHPMWTGILALAYADTAPSSQKSKFDHKPDEVLNAVHGHNSIYIWSMSDDLNPKLILECNREILTLKFCPHDENILVGGCINGQIAVWDITNKLAKVEREEFLTVAQQNYRKYLFSLMYWFKNTKNDALVPATVMSCLIHSHTNSVRDIEWISPRLSYTRCGKVSKIPKEEDVSLQFLSCGEDGLVLIWDLKYYPVLGKSEEATMKAKQILTRRPSVLTHDVPELKRLDKIFRPIYRLMINRPDNRPLPLMDICLFNSTIEYKPRDLFQTTQHSLHKRVIYKPIIPEPLENYSHKLAAVSMEGDVLIAKWEGIEVDSGLPVNKETCTFSTFRKSHVGLGLSISLSPFFKDILLTAGGKNVCIWRESFLNEPVTKKTGVKKFTMAIWSPYRHRTFLTSREDGTIEIWDLSNRSFSPTYEINFSGVPITGFYIHELKLIANGIGIAEESPHFRTFYIPEYLSTPVLEDIDVGDKLMNKAIFRKTAFVEWERNWLREHEEELKKAREEHEEELRRKEQEMEHERVKRENEQLRREELLMKHKQMGEKPQPGKYREWAEANWMKQQQERVYHLLIAKKKLNQDDLVRQQEPLKTSIEQALTKKEKQRQQLGRKEQIFNNVVNKMISNISQRYGEYRSASIEMGTGEAGSLKHSFIEQYKEIEDTILEYVELNPHEYEFNWLSFQATTLARHRALNGYLKRPERKDMIHQKRSRLSSCKVTNESILSGDDISF